MYTISQLGEGELDIAAGTLTVKGESAMTRLLLTVRAEFAFVRSAREKSKCDLFRIKCLSLKIGWLFKKKKKSCVFSPCYGSPYPPGRKGMIENTASNYKIVKKKTL